MNKFILGILFLIAAPVYAGNWHNLTDGSHCYQQDTSTGDVFCLDGAGVDITLTASELANILTGNLKVGNGTPSVTQNGEDAYIEGTFEADGAAEFDGAVDFDSTITVGTTALTTTTLTAMGRASFTVCGDATTVNNNTVYYGPSQVLTSSATAASVVCDSTAVGNATEATADAPAFTAKAFYVLGMSCYHPDSGATLTFTGRSAEAGLTPATVVTTTDNQLQGMTAAPSTTAVASAATFAVAVASTSDVGTVPFRCDVSVAY
jgi:hypothetical protein